MGKSRKELALEEERDELCKLLFLEKDEWRRFRAHYDTVLTLEAEVKRLRAENDLYRGASRNPDDIKTIERLRAAIWQALDYPYANRQSIDAILRRALTKPEGATMSDHKMSCSVDPCTCGAEGGSA
jgi:hypothetical protein